MKHSVEGENLFVVDLLTTLRHEKFSPLGWGRFLCRSWQMACQTADDNPTLKRSWMWVTIWIGMLAIALLISNVFFEGMNPSLRLLPGFLFCVLWQQSDLFWHLGLNRQVKTRILLPTVGIANTCTWLRGLASAYLLGRFVGGLATPSGLALFVLLCGIVTDILDGQIARRTDTQSKLGQIGDGEADFCLHLALTFILLQNAVLPLWLGLIMLFRFGVPLIAALASYFLLAHPVQFSSTIWGKYAGLAQCLYFLALLAPPQFTPFTHFVNFPLLVITLFLLLAAPTAQIAQNVRAISKE